MKIIFYIFTLFIGLYAKAYDCSSVKPFTPKSQQNVKVTVSRYIWSQDHADYEDICSVSTVVNLYDVQGREEEAYYCLKLTAAEVVICNTKINGDDAELEVLPASWIRSWGSSSAREYRFHAYVVKKADPSFYYDIFSRSLLTDLSAQNIIIEGSLKTGPGNPQDGFWIRMEFQK